ncbi:MAG: hypothetical protein COW42_07445 [Deltaproteobacteria bacterium CG17_big_fil_post_rev_8_21_14_2_50_63_7]|nr:MAG: hypothetical protein COW42_07445 [Deltaproteobacteria bacterium CG17_big_fil_post_rev_8_21_14_2_50_63_7]
MKADTINLRKASNGRRTRFVLAWSSMLNNIREISRWVAELLEPVNDALAACLWLTNLLKNLCHHFP